MAKALFVSLPLHGHVNPTLALVRELAARGHDITYYATDRFAAAIGQAGVRYRCYRDGPLGDLNRLPAQTHELASVLMRLSSRVLEAELDGFRATQPDYVITDSVAPWGQWLGQILQRPVVTSISTLAFNRHVMAFAAARGVRPRSARLLVSKLRHVAKAFLLRRRLSSRYGVSGPGVLRSVMGSSELNIVYTSRYFQPCAETFDARYHFVGPLVDRVESAAFPWERLGRGDVVYVSLGTLFNVDTSFYRTCFDAFAGEDFQVILSTGPDVASAALGVVPSNFIVEPHVPQLAVLRRVKAFVTHGGMNSVSESLSCGVPMVVIPQMGEQALVGRRVEHLGAGLYLAKEAVTADRLRASVREVLAGERFGHQAGIVRQSFLETGGAAAAADAIEAFTA